MNKEFWDQKYLVNEIPWDAGSITAPIKEYVDQLTDKSLSILIPGSGNGHELEYLYQLGFKNSYGLDVSKTAVENFRKRVPDFPSDQLVVSDFFKLNGSYDLILEQTFFCAIDPATRSEYAAKMASLLNPSGKLVGVLFDFPLTKAGPPFGGNKEEYLTYFDPYFEIHKMENCYNSIKPRSGRELFMSLQVK